MRILVLALDVNPASTSGEFVHLRSVVSSWDARGHEVTVVLPAVEGASAVLEEVSRDTGVKYLLNDRKTDVGTVSFCTATLREFRPDLLYERRFSPKIGVALRALWGIPLAVEINGMIEEEAAFGKGVSQARKLTSKTRKKLRTSLFRSCDLIVAVTDGLKDELVRQYDIPSDRISVVYNGADVDLFRPRALSEAKKTSGLDQHDDYVCYVGSLQPWHEVDNILRALKSLVTEFPRLKLLIVGEGMIRHDVEKLASDLGIEERVMFTGHTPHSQVPDLINSSLVCISLFKESSYGWSPLKVYEYLACGKPVIASKHRGLEFLDAERCGIRIPSPEPEVIADAIGSLLRNEDLREQMGRSGREYVVREHSWGGISERLIREFEEVISVA